MPSRLRHFLTFITALALLGAVPGCGTAKGLLSKIPKKKDKNVKEEEKTGKDTLIGVIEMVNPEQKFVLIRTTSRFTLPTGTKVQTLSSAGLKSVMQISPEYKPNLLAADIVEGYPQKGQTVFIPYDPASAATVPTSTSPSSAENPIPGVPPGLPPALGNSVPKLWAPEDNPTPGVPPTQSGATPPPAPAPSSNDPVPGVPPTDLPPVIR